MNEHNDRIDYLGLAGYNMQPAHNINDYGISIDDTLGNIVVRDQILRRCTSIQRDELIYHPDALQYIKDSHLAHRRHIIHLLDAYFDPYYCFGLSRYLLLGSKIGPLVASTATVISDIRCTIYDWPDDYDQSASFVAANKDATYNQYKMRAEISGWPSIYTEEEYRIICQLFGLLDGVLRDLEKNF